MSAIGNFRQALRSIRSARWRSLFTMTGIIFGVASVITIVSISEGVKKQVVGQTNKLGTDILVILPGPAPSRALPFNPKPKALPAAPISNLTQKDLAAISKLSEVDIALPITIMNGVVASDQVVVNESLIIATLSQAPEILNQPIEYGSFYRDLNEDKHTVVIGPRLAENLFKDFSPLGSKLQFRGQDYTVRGVFEKFDNSPLAANADLNSAAFFHPSGLNESNSSLLPISQILIRPKPGGDSAKIHQALTLTLKQSHNGVIDFTVLTSSDLIDLVNREANLLTGLIAGVAAISLFVGGVGIMNTMLLAVIERTHEIGIRKAIGASNGQILTQFLSESIVLSLWGGVLGLAVAGLANYLLRVFTNYQPVITWSVVALAAGVSVLMGIIFGIIPALKAARKNPIDALRYS